MPFHFRIFGVLGNAALAVLGLVVVWMATDRSDLLMLLTFACVTALAAFNMFALGIAARAVSPLCGRVQRSRHEQ